MGRFAVAIAPPNTLRNKENCIRNSLSINCAALAPDNELRTNASQRLPVQKKRWTVSRISKKNFQTSRSNYSGDRIVSHKASGDDRRYRFCGYECSPGHDTQKLLKRLPSRTMRSFRKEKAHSDKQRKKCYHSQRSPAYITIHWNYPWGLHTFRSTSHFHSP